MVRGESELDSRGGREEIEGIRKSKTMKEHGKREIKTDRGGTVES